MTITFEVTIKAPREEIAQALRNTGASDEDITRLLKPGSTLEIGDLYNAFCYHALESEVTSVESDQGIIES
jgi:hypothetical protein